jgi:hypothetical protein
MKNLIVVGHECNDADMTYQVIKRVSFEHNVGSIFLGAEKGFLTSVECQAHLFANHQDLVVFDASINIPKRKPFAFPISQMSRIFERAKLWGNNNVLLVLHTGIYKRYNRIIKKALAQKMDVVIVRVF